MRKKTCEKLILNSIIFVSFFWGRLFNNNIELILSDTEINIIKLEYSDIWKSNYIIINITF